MSYDIGLYKTKNSTDDPVEVEMFAEGGTQVMGGSSQAELNITYNYSWFYYLLLDEKNGLRWLYGKQAKDCIERLRTAVGKLGKNQYVVHDEGYQFNDPGTHHLTHIDYWASTPGNAGHALDILLRWASEHPEAYFNGD